LYPFTTAVQVIVFPVVADVGEQITVVVEGTWVTKKLKVPMDGGLYVSPR
jgi:hypothetical protein